MLATPELSITAWANALNEMRTNIDLVATQTGDLTIGAINDIQRNRADVTIGYNSLNDDAQVNASKVAQVVSDAGGPATNGETVTAQADLMTALDAWEILALAAARSPSKSEIVQASTTQYRDGVSLSQIKLMTAVPATFADPLRTSPELVAVQDALTALGA